MVKQESGAAERPAVFLDRDGTIIEEVGYLSDPAELVLIPGAAPAIRRINQAGLAAVVITNQSGLARGFFDEERLVLIHERLKMALEKEGAFLDGIYFCPHHPEGQVGRYRKVCACRKPKTGMIMQAAEDLSLVVSDSYMIGDHITDMKLAVNAGMRSVHVLTGHGKEVREEADETIRSRASHTSRDLSDAVDWILAEQDLLNRQ
jgi:D-glycero-D-manno-heptose 1,7-bisphosphate phosphatase